MKRLDSTRRELMAAALVESNSIRATSRLTGVAYNTVLKFVADMGWAARMYLDEHMRNLDCRRLQVDEIWAFCYAKDKNVPEHMKPAFTWQRGCEPRKPLVGSVWTWVAIDADTKIIPTFHVGTRDAGCACEFLSDLAPRLKNRVQLTSDGHKAYLAGCGKTRDPIDRGVPLC